MKPAKLFLFAFIATAFAGINRASADDFKLIRKNDIVSVYEHWISLNHAQPVREIKAVLNVKASIPAITYLLSNDNKDKVWRMNTAECKTIKTNGDEAWLSYFRYEIPWPFSDQDCCLINHVVNRQANRLEVSFENQYDSRFPLLKNVTRLSGTRGKWILEDQLNGNITVTYLISTDRSAKVPRWLSDPVVQDNLIKTLTAFKNILEK